MEYEEVVDLCKEHNIKFEENTARAGSFKKLHIYIPKGRDSTILNVYGRKCSEIFTNIPEFYKYKFVKGYEAIWSSEDDFLECEIITPYFGGFMRRLNKKLGDEDVESPDKNEDVVEILSPITDSKIEIGSSTDMFASLAYLKHERQMMHLPNSRGPYTYTLKVYGASIKTHSRAVEVINTILASICFNINVAADISVQLAPEIVPRKNPVRPNRERVDIPIVKYEYDIEPLSLYWHAENFRGMSLQKYLSYYQAIEYYFTIYSFEEAQRKVRNLIKNPTFNVDKDKDLSKILNIIKYSGSSNSFGNELAQLKATLTACVNIDELREWLDENKEREQYFESKPAKKISKIGIRPNLNDDDLFTQVSKRIYEIRCRIVHTKGTENNIEVLHPMSHETSIMGHDVELIKILCTKVISSNGRPLSIKNA